MCVDKSAIGAWKVSQVIRQNQPWEIAFEGVLGAHAKFCMQHILLHTSNTCTMHINIVHVRL